MIELNLKHEAAIRIIAARAWLIVESPGRSVQAAVAATVTTTGSRVGPWR